MRALICGSRTWDDAWSVNRVIAGLRADVGWSGDLTIIHGAAKGADTLAGRAAEHVSAHVAVYPAQWDRHGKAAGPIRNQLMLDEGAPDVVFAFTDNLAESAGTRDMVTRARAAGVPVYVIGRG